MSADKAMVLRFLQGHDLSAARSRAQLASAPLSPTESFEKAMELQDFALEHAPLCAELAANRARDEEVVRAVWVRLKAAYR